MITLWLAAGLLARQSEGVEQPQPQPVRGGWVESDAQRRRRLKREADERDEQNAVGETARNAWRKVKGIEPPQPIEVAAVVPVVVSDDDDEAIALLLMAA